ncbi:MAG: rhomboid family intramembrane serine protease [Kofleriaceae bacterium]
MSDRRRAKFDTSQLRITRGALIVVALQLGFSLVYLLVDDSTKRTLGEWLVTSPSQVFEHYRVWTLITSPLLEISFLSLLLNVFMLWMFVPTLERFWGEGRFLRFVAVTSIVGSIAGVALGQLIHRNDPIYGLSPFTFASIVAFGIIYARQPVQFFGVLPLTGRQMMYGFLGFLGLFIVLQGFWTRGAADAGAMIAAVIMVSKRWSPGLALRRWRIARARARLSVIEGGAPKPPVKPTTPRKKPDERFLN